MKKLLTILLVLIVATGCGGDETATFESMPNVESKYCANQLELISAPTEYKEIEFNFNQTGKQSFEEIQNELGKDICDSLTYFAIPFDLDSSKLKKTNTSIPLLVRIDWMCESPRPCVLHSCIDILFNSNHQLLIEGAYIQREEIDSSILNQYLENESLNVSAKQTHIGIQWDIDVHKNILALVFGEIIDGYLLTVEHYVIKTYNKSTCELSSHEIEVVKKEIPFKLELQWGEQIITPEILNDNEEELLDKNEFKSFTKSMYNSDGALSDVIGLKSFNFINNYTVAFAHHFNTNPELTEKDLKLWASFIYGEIQISREGKELDAVLELEKKILLNIKESGKEYKSIVKKLIVQIKEAHSKSIKN